MGLAASRTGAANGSAREPLASSHGAELAASPSEESLPQPLPSAEEGAVAASQARTDLEILWVPGALLLGCAMGLALPSKPGKEQRLSEVLGWTYFCCWSVSFYPQVVQNFRRRSVRGLSVEYQLLNFVGFACYSVFNASLFWSEDLQREYTAAYGGRSSAVQANDVVFAIHAASVTLVTLLQIAAFYDQTPLKRAELLLRRAVVASVAIFTVAAVGMAGFIWVTGERVMDWLVYIELLSGVKVLISTVKYCPQAWMNYRRKSTDGWSIHNVLLDFLGGSLSIAQLLLDCSSSRHWTKLTGDPAKFMLGNLSMFFDVIFMVQHYCLYPLKRRTVLLPDAHP